MKFINNYNKKEFEGVNIKLPSKTTQGESYTVKELMERAVQQGQLLQAPEGIYIDQELEKINSMYSRPVDLIDVEEHMEYHKTMLEQMEMLQLKKEAEAQREADAKPAESEAKGAASVDEQEG